MFDMLGNVVKNLFSKPATRMFPVVRRDTFKGTRGCLGINIESCIFCGICVRKCPSDAIVVNKNDKTWQVDPFKCIICGACTEVCPKKCLHMNEQYTTPAYSKYSDKHVQQPVKLDEDKAVQNQ